MIIDPYRFGGNIYNLVQSWVKYRNTDFAYITSSGFSDAGTISVGARVIKYVTVGTPDTNFTTSGQFAYTTDRANGRVLIREQSGGIIRVWNQTVTTSLSTITPPIGHTFEQGCCFDPVNVRIISANASAGQIKIFDVAGYLAGNITATHLETLTCPTVSQDIHLNLQYTTGKLFVCVQGLDTPIQIWERSGSAYALTETLWFSARGGAGIDNINHGIVCFDNTATALRWRTQTFSGLDTIFICERPFTSGFIGEGMCVMPDGTIIMAEPSGFDFGIVGGNRLMWADPTPNKDYLKFDRSPSMRPFTMSTSLGVTSGVFDTQIITAQVGTKIYGPVYDTNGFTDTETAGNWGFEVSTGGDADMTFIGSNTAPTVSSQTNDFSSLPAYVGWGATVPSAEQATPGTFRYKQQVLQIKDAV
jgi:hypothetical protein